MVKSVINKIQYYLFVKKILLFITMFFAFLAIPFYFFLKSDYVSEYIGYFLNKYLVLRYGSIEAFGLMSGSEQQALLEQIFITCFIIGLVPIFFIHLYSQIYVFRNITSKYYSIIRTNNLWDDIGFAITFSLINLLFSYQFQMLFDSFWYKVISILVIQTFVFHLLVKNNAYSYVVKKRARALKTWYYFFQYCISLNRL